MAQGRSFGRRHALVAADDRRALIVAAVLIAVPFQLACEREPPVAASEAMFWEVLASSPTIDGPEVRVGPGEDIQAAVDSFASGGTVVLAPGEWRLGSTLAVPSNTAIVARGQSTLRFPPHTVGIMNADTENGNEDILIRGVRLVGSGWTEARDTANGIAMVKVKRARIEDVVVEDFDGYNIVLFPGTERSAVIASESYRASKEGIEVYGGRECVVFGNLVRGAGHNGILVWNGARDTLVASNVVVGAVSTGIYVQGRGNDVTEVVETRNTVIRNNLVLRSGFNGIRIGSSPGIVDVTVRANTIVRPGRMGIVDASATGRPTPGTVIAGNSIERGQDGWILGPDEPPLDENTLLSR